MTAVARGWELEAEVAASLPALAWVARVTPGHIRAVCGKSVQIETDALFEGTWAGPESLTELPDQTTIFGSGLVIRSNEAIVVTPSHHLEGVHSATAADGSVMVANSLAGALVGAHLELDPGFDYPSLLTEDLDRWHLLEDEKASPPRPIYGALQPIPTTTSQLTTHFFENAVIGEDLAVRVRRKPRERPFESFADFHERLLSTTRSLFENARPYEPIVSLSGGYDSTAVAVVAAEAGCKRAFGFETSRPARSDASTVDSGRAAADRLGLSYSVHDRLSYRVAEGAPEAEFLSTGMVGEEVVFAAAEGELHRSTMLTGYWAGTQWGMSRRDDWLHMVPSTTAGTSLTEFRLRADFYDVPLPVFGAAQARGDPSLLDLDEMDPYRIKSLGHYDRPIPRRLIEEAGIPRGTFASKKRAVNVLLQHDALANFSAGTQHAVAAFAAAERRTMPTSPRPRLSKFERAMLRLAEPLHAGPLVRGTERRRMALQHFEPQLGNLLFRWAAKEMRPRYAATERLWQ